jgi:hypothetical protein
VSGRRAALHLECVLFLMSRSIAVSEGTEWNQRSLPNVALHSGSFMIGVVQLLNCFLIASLVPPVIEGFPTTQTHFPPKRQRIFLSPFIILINSMSLNYRNIYKRTSF